MEVLRSIEGKHPIVGKILEYRKYAKLVSTYIDGLVPHIRPDGKIHTYFNQAQTTTGRLSSSNPNLQNISTRDEESKAIRKAFYYDEPGKYIASFDYGQIELRILAALSHCQAYIDIFASDRDVHSETARRIFNIPEGEEIPHLARRRAKAVNFAIIYGVTPFGLADQIGGTPGKPWNSSLRSNTITPRWINTFKASLMTSNARDMSPRCSAGGVISVR